MISKIKYVMEHNLLLKRLIPLCRKTGLVHLLHIIKARIDGGKNKTERKGFQQFYNLHQQEFHDLSVLLADEFSKKTLRKVLEYRMTWKVKALKGVIVEPQYFQRDIFLPVKDEIFIDGGAYVGDTVESFIKNFAEKSKWRGNYKRVYAWEPDAINISQMRKNLCKYKNIEIVPYGMWKEKTELKFFENGNAGSKIAETGTKKVDVDSIDQIHLSDKITFIKMDIEGSEKEALQGARHVIQRDKPRLAICIYHRPEDLYEIPFLIKEFVPEYKLYIRHHSDTFAETVVYATL